MRSIEQKCPAERFFALRLGWCARVKNVRFPPIADIHRSDERGGMLAPQVTRANMFEAILVADPSFLPHWQKFNVDWADDAEPPLYLALASLAEHLLERLGRGDTEGFGSVFAIVETWHADGDAYVSEAATIGLLESFQNQLGGNDRSYRRRDGVTAAALEPWLGPETKRWWYKLYRFWDGDEQALRLDSGYPLATRSGRSGRLLSRRLRVARAGTVPVRR
jgi:hypothetical protein